MPSRLGNSERGPLASGLALPALAQALAPALATLLARALAQCLAVGLAIAACGDGPAPGDGKREGKQLASALADQLAADGKLVAPYRCARAKPELLAPQLAGIEASLAAQVLNLKWPGRGGGPLTIAYVADARGAEAETQAAVAALSKRLAAKHVAIIVSLGGLAEEAADLEVLMSALLGSSDALLVAIPGDRESIPAHRAAVAALATSGRRVIDGSAYKLIRVEGVVLANMPGIAMSSNLVAGNDGCEHLEVDAEALLAAAPRDADALIVNSYAPLRMEGLRAQDYGLGAIQVGERALMPLLAGQSVAVAVHGMVAPATSANKGKARVTKEALLLATGSLDPLERATESLLLTISGRELSWQRLQVD